MFGDGAQQGQLVGWRPLAAWTAAAAADPWLPSSLITQPSTLPGAQPPSAARLSSGGRLSAGGVSRVGSDFCTLGGYPVTERALEVGGSGGGGGWVICTETRRMGRGVCTSGQRQLQRPRGERAQEARRGQPGEASGRQGPWAGPPAWGTLGGGSPVQGLDTCQDID